MPDIPHPPNPIPAAKGLAKQKPALYVALAVGVIVTVYLMRRRSDTAPSTVPSTDPNAATGLPDAAVGSYQGYDQPPYDNTITGPALLDFILSIRDQNIASAGQTADTAGAAAQLQYQLQLAAIESASAPTGATGGPTGGGLPSDPIPNPAPPPAHPTPHPAPASTCASHYPNFPHHNPANGPVSPGSCFQDCGNNTCRKHKKVRDHGHCYKNGKRTHISFENLGGRC